MNFDNTNGSNPQGDLLLTNSFLYGTTFYGGTNSKGVLFKIKPDGSSFAKLLDFDGTTNGSNPSGSVITDGAYLYGMTSYRGSIAMDSIFKFKLDPQSAFAQNTDDDADANTMTSTVNTIESNMQAVTLATDDAQKETYVIYPNPASESANILYYSETATRSAIKILDLQGRTIQQEEIELSEGLNSKTVNISNLSVGIYFVSIGTKVQKLMVE